MARTRRHGPDPVDKHVGARIKLRRTMMGLSQEALGARIGVAFQQVQKYERGTNRVSASALYRIALALDVPIAFFFDVMEGAPATLAVAAIPLNREALELMRHYFAMKESPRRKVFELVKCLAKEGG